MLLSSPIKWYTKEGHIQLCIKYTSTFKNNTTFKTLFLWPAGERCNFDLSLPEAYCYSCRHHKDKDTTEALAGVAQWTECHPANQKVAGSVPGQGTRPGCGPGLQLGA